MTYSRVVVEHFARPRNLGTLGPGADVIEARGGDREQGAEFRLSARIADDRIVEARAGVYGCPHCIAAASWVAERLPGMRREALRAWRWRVVGAALEVPPEKRGRLLALEDAMHALAAAWEARAEGTPPAGPA